MFIRQDRNEQTEQNVTVVEEAVSSTQTSKHSASVIDRENKSQKPAGRKRGKTTTKERQENWSGKIVREL